MILTVMMALAMSAADAETFKCLDASGKAISQTTPCPNAAADTLKFQAPGAAAPAVSGSVNSTSAPDVAHPLKGRVPSEADFKGPRETWDRLTQAVRRGDRNAALKELTPAAQQRLGPMFDNVGAKSGALNADELGSVRAVMLAGNGLATLKLTRKNADGSYAHDVMLIRDADGRWLIDAM